MSPADLAVEAVIAESLLRFRLPTLAAELVPRFVEAGRADVLPLVAEVLQLESQDRRHRRVERLRRAAKLPPSKTFDTLDEARLPPTLGQQLRELARGDFLSEPRTSSPSACPASARATLPAPLATPSLTLATRCSSRRPRTGAAM